MAAPNIRRPTTINLRTFNVKLSSTNPTDLLENVGGSGKVLKVIACRATNVDGTSNVDVTLTRADRTNSPQTTYALASTITVPADAALELIEETAPVALEEDQALVATASAGGDLEVTGTYLEIS